MRAFLSGRPASAVTVKVLDNVSYGSALGAGLLIDPLVAITLGLPGLKSYNTNSCSRSAKPLWIATTIRS
jgi:hypothetical protein